MTGSSGRIVVVTGGSRGIGAAVVRRFCDDGATVVVLDRDEPAEAHVGVDYRRVDVAEAEAVTQAFAAIGAAHGRVDVLINNAGINRIAPVARLADEDWDAVLATNLRGPFLCMKAASGLLPTGAAIVNVASTAALLGIGGRGAYTAAKAGLVGLTRVVALEFAPRQVRVNSIAPGSVRTALVEAAIAGGHISESQLRSRIPLGRLGTVDEIAGTAAFLAGEAASYVTGQVLVVDGGWTIQGVPYGEP